MSSKNPKYPITLTYMPAGQFQQGKNGGMFINQREGWIARCPGYVGWAPTRQQAYNAARRFLVPPKRKGTK